MIGRAQPGRRSRRVATSASATARISRMASTAQIAPSPASTDFNLNACLARTQGRQPIPKTD